ncbi:MAG: hypothetical protein KJ985_10870, partial [Proteobacteria bacterium]|nr:hypothetical protein [Pseudomonadota bacterium]
MFSSLDIVALLGFFFLHRDIFFEIFYCSIGSLPNSLRPHKSQQRPIIVPIGGTQGIDILFPAIPGIDQVAGNSISMPCVPPIGTIMGRCWLLCGLNEFGRDPIEQ